MFLLSLTLSLAPLQDLRPFEALDVFELEMVQDPQVSPDGARVVYGRQRFVVQEDRAESTLWIVDADGGNHRPLTSPDVGISGARWVR